MSTDQDTFVNGIEISDTSPATASSGSLFTIGGISILNTTNATTTSASFLTLGGSYVQGNSIMGGTVQLLSTTAATNTSTGTLTIAGGIGISGSAYGNFGNFNYIQSNISATIPNIISSNISVGTLSATSFNPINITCQNLYSTNSITASNLIVINISTNSLYINSTASSNIPTIFSYNSNNTTGTGLAFSSWSGTQFIEKARFDSVGNFLINTTQPSNSNTLYLNSLSTTGSDGATFDTQFGINSVISLAVQGSKKYTIGIDSSDAYKLKFNRGLFNLQLNTLTFDQSGNVGINTATPTSKLQVIGDTNISGNLTVGTSFYTPSATIGSLNLNNLLLTNLTSGSAYFISTTASNNTGSGAVVINGGLGLGGDLNIGGNTLINGNLTIFGSTVTVNSTNVSIVDNIIQLNVNSTGVADSGLQFGRYQIANNVGSGDIVNDTIAFSGTVITGSTTTLLNLSSGASSSTDFYIGYWIKIVSGTNINQVRQITAYNSTTKTATLATALTTIPVNSDTLNLYGNVYPVDFFNQSTSTFQLAFTNSTTTSVVNIVTRANLMIGNLISNLITTNNLQVTNATITNLNLSGLSLTNLTVSNLFATNSSLTNFIGINQTIANQQVTNESVTNETVSNLNTTSATLGNTVNSNITIGTLNVTGISNLMGLVQSTNQTGTNATISNIVSTNIINTNANITNIVNNVITGSNLIYTNGTIVNLIGTNTTISNQFGTNLNYTNLTSSNVNITTLTASTFLSTNSSITNLVSTNYTNTNALITNITSTNLSSTNGIFINGIFTNTSSTNSRITNETIGIINVTGTGITTTNLNFTGNLYQNGVLYTPSSTQWTTTATNISYTSGNVIIGGILSSSNLITTNGSIANAIGINLNYTNISFTKLLGTNSTISNSVGVNLNYTNISTANLAVQNLVINNLSLGNLVTNSVTAQNFLMTGTTSASNILYIDCQSSQIFPGQLVFKNSYGTGDFRIYGDGGDVQWQGGGGRSCQMGAWHEIRLTGGRTSTSTISYITGSNGTYNTIIQNSNDSIALTIQGNATQNVDLTQWTNSSNTVLSRIDRLGNLQITSTADSISSITGGSITTFGGASISKSVNIGSTTVAINNSSGALIVSGGGGFDGDIYANNMYIYMNTTVASVALTPSPLTNKGDLYTYATSGERLATGTYAQTLISNTTANTGLQWVSPLTQIGFYGSEYNYVSVQATSGVTSTTGTLKTSLTTGTLVGGTYKIEIDYNISPNTSANQNCEVAVYLNATTATGFNVGTTTSNLIHDNIYRPSQTTFNTPFSCNIVRTFGNVIQTIGVYYRTLVNGQAINIGNTSILFYRIQ